MHGVRVGIILISPDGFVTPLYYRFDFDCTNNFVEYMRLLFLHLKYTISMNVKSVHIYGYARLILNQVNKVYNTKDENLIPYKDLVTRLLNHFDN